ncbi:mitochondrial carrier domain-containing protein [Dichotomopilus funicola]|uniref:Mitochondrial carrier domain-containing protein n=1 Tax=Dichotomopilus funicola TaxID=1934379 RepID=A0AAN6ZS15_9PEZI|nr:mitochondrial carrier domain-containing protein [Dichotomopilus funicola]
MTRTEDAGLSPALVETVAGLSAGSMATLIVHPLDIVKTRMQIYRTTLSTTTKTTSAATPPTTVSLIRSLVATDRPLAALYRGLTPNLLGNATSWASFFFFKSRLERAIAHLRAPPQLEPSPAAKRQEPQNDTRHSPTTEPSTDTRKHRLTPLDFFLASLGAGALTQIITNPIWVLKTRMLSSDRSAAGAYPSMWAGAVRLLREEGPRGFYRGLGVGMLAVSHGAVQFAVYDPLKRVYLAKRGKESESEGGGRSSSAGSKGSASVSNEATVVLSTVSKLVAGATTYPLQVLRSRLQQHDAEAQFGRGLSGVVRRLWREEGIRGFYRGVMPGVFRVLPATWVTFLVYENVRYYLPRWARNRETARVGPRLP